MIGRTISGTGIWICWIAMVTSASAASINVDFNDVSSATYSGTAVAPDSGTFWNGVSGAVTSRPLTNSAGVGTTVTMSLLGGTQWTTPYTNHGLMYDGFYHNGTSRIFLYGIPTNKTYDLYVYCPPGPAGSSPSTWAGQIGLWNGNYTYPPNVPRVDWSAQNNCLLFTNVYVDADGDLEIWYRGENCSPTMVMISGFQLYEVGGGAVSNAPSISNAGGASGVTSNSATLNGNLVSTGGLPTTVSCFWGPNDGATVKSNWSNELVFAGACAAGSLATNIQGLASGQTYYYRYYASNALGGTWASSSASFSTPAPAGPAPTAPFEVSGGLMLWLRADMGVLTNGSGQVTNWLDYSGQGRVATNTGSPIYVGASTNLNNKPAISFDGVSAGFKLGNLSNSFPTIATLFLVVSISDTSGYNLFTTRGNDGWWMDEGGNGIPGVFVHSRLGGAGPMPKSGSYVFQINASDSWAMLTNGVTKDVLSGTYSGGSDYRIAMGDDGGGDQSSRSFSGQIPEIMVYNRTLTEEEQNLVGYYLASKYGIGSAYRQIPRGTLLCLR